MVFKAIPLLKVQLWCLPLILMACAGAPTAPTGQQAEGQDRAGRIAAECRLLAAAHAEMQARGQVPPPDILVGCPGHEALRDAMPLKSQTAALRVANRAVLPPAVRAAGPRAGIVYRRMITRGVPEAVAAQVAQGALLAAVSR